MPGKILAVLVCFCLCAVHDAKKQTKSEPWDYLLLAQFWPATSCYVYFEGSCKSVPQGVTGWTIHGLWPSRPGDEGPQYCNQSLPFDYNKIKSLSPQLKVQWPFYNESADPTTLWAHEWEKHGTCASSMPVLSGEVNYFGTTMQLQKPINLAGAFLKSGIIPSRKSQYAPQDFFDAVQKNYGVVPNIACSYNHKNQQHYIEQVWLCLSKTFKLQDCPTVSKASHCPRSSNKRKHPKHPGHYSDCPQPTSKTLWYLPPTPQPSLRFRPERRGQRGVNLFN